MIIKEIFTIRQIFVGLKFSLSSCGIQNIFKICRSKRKHVMRYEFNFYFGWLIKIFLKNVFEKNPGHTLFFIINHWFTVVKLLKNEYRVYKWWVETLKMHRSLKSNRNKEWFAGLALLAHGNIFKSWKTPLKNSSRMALVCASLVEICK